MNKPAEEDIEQAVKELLEIMRKMDEFIFDPSYRIIRSMDDEDDNSDSQNS